MKISIASSLIAAALAVTPFVAQPEPASTSMPPGRSMVYQLKGTAIGEMREIDTDGDGIADTTANCFDVGLFDPRTGKQIGTATDCLSDVSVVIDDEPGNQPFGLNIALTGTTFFNLPGGTLVAQGLTTVRPVLQPTERDGRVFTHITGANGEDGIRYGTGMFQNFGGTARLSGIIDLARFGTMGEITFDCLFVVDLEL